MHRFALAVAVLVLPQFVYAQQTPPPPAPANVAGSWSGSFKPFMNGQPQGEERAMVVLKQEGSVLTGTAGPPTQQNAISRGKAEATKEGTVVTFDLVSPNGTTLKFEFKLVDGHLKGTASAERDGQKLSAVMDLEKAK